VSPACPYELCDGTGFVVDEATNTATPCRCRPQRLSRAKSRSLSAVVPKRFRGVSFDRAPVVDMSPDVVREVRRYTEDIADRLDAGRGLWFMGDVGTGKTTLAMLVSKAALDEGRSVAIYSLPRLLAEIRNTYKESAERSYLELLDRLTSVDLLHIDDLGVGRAPSTQDSANESQRSNTPPNPLSDWVLEQLYAIFNARYEDQRALVVTTNLDHEALREQIGERTVSRLIEICGDPLPLYGHDRRIDLRSA
jgi:DNA replication protein DnaC